MTDYALAKSASGMQHLINPDYPLPMVVLCGIQGSDPNPDTVQAKPSLQLTGNVLSYPLSAPPLWTCTNCLASAEVREQRQQARLGQ